MPPDASAQKGHRQHHTATPQRRRFTSPRARGLAHLPKARVDLHALYLKPPELVPLARSGLMRGALPVAGRACVAGCVACGRGWVDRLAVAAVPRVLFRVLALLREPVLRGVVLALFRVGAASLRGTETRCSTGQRTLSLVAIWRYSSGLGAVPACA